MFCLSGTAAPGETGTPVTGMCVVPCASETVAKANAERDADNSMMATICWCLSFFLSPLFFCSGRDEKTSVNPQGRMRNECVREGGAQDRKDRQIKE
jgi:hypothetical protein